MSFIAGINMSLLKLHTKYRIKLLFISVLAVFAGFYLRSLSAAAEQKPLRNDGRPNILLIMADDWSWPYAGAYGDSIVHTPGFDKLAEQGILFTHAFCPAPSCTPSRLSILTGQYPHRLNEGANHKAGFSRNYDVYTEILERAGYFVGKYKKGAQFGSLEGTGWEHDPAGPDFKSFAEFLDLNYHGKPFCFWYGSSNPHRPYPLYYIQNSDKVIVPGFLPDLPEVRFDILNYYEAIRQFDVELSITLYQLEVRNLIDNTIVIVTSDNGMPFPRGKATCYDAGLRVPLAIIWPKYMQGGRISDEFINLSDLAPTILEAAGLSSPPEMTAVSFFDLLVDSLQPPERGASPGELGARSDQHCEGIIRDAVFVERERHALGRGGGTDSLGTLSYPIRGVRTKEFLYLVNFRPHLWPACDPPKFNDIDSSPSKTNVLKYRDSLDSLSLYFDLSCGMRPREELYDMRNDPYQLNNLAADSAYQEIKQKLWQRLHQWMIDTNDPRAHGEDDRWDNYGWDSSLEKQKNPNQQ